MDRFIIVLKADGDELQLQTRHIGPFDCYAAAYAALCELPAPVNGGHKFIQQLERPQGTPSLSSAEKARAERLHQRLYGAADAALLADALDHAIASDLFRSGSATRAALREKRRWRF